ncbi:MAG: GSCFA domain-containing protein [Bacteroidales bacterium]
MMNRDTLFRTLIVPQKAAFPIDHNSHGLFLGSCFTEHIGGAMQAHKFPVVVNPFGVLYNPASIAGVVKRLLQNRPFELSDLYNYQERYLSFLHDTSFSSTNPAVTLERMNTSYSQARKQLERADYLFFTFGTARVFEHRSSGQIVSNCHKIPAREFYRRLLSVDDIVNQWQELLDTLWEQHPARHIIFTVSPVRHWKDGAVGNQYSKAILHCAIHQLVEQDDRLHYFPSYEIMMDDLRDYRFYADDMIHPSEMAVNYIWEFFQDTYFKASIKQLVQRIQKVRKAYQHRILGDNSKALLTFAQKQLDEIEALLEMLPKNAFQEEVRYFQDLIEQGKAPSLE